ncbi:hypothetical protein GL4_0643 [Methyloceanibacter caenitepidi]|uniref:Uncharacterized protein n=2 Tax=Methyloceanibacter caenitepidi TaxID=1384459 RepID=A0A0A8K020_9HYPH|nr:hypothetical protein GL4_0643 [Methyloceanibacter caenitepidi]
MCFGDDSAKDRARAERRKAAQTAQQTKNEERKRQRDIRRGERNVDSAFRPFNNSYFKKFRNDYTGYYFPQLEDQFKEGKASLFGALAERGLDESTVGIDAQADLLENYQGERARVANEAADRSNELRGRVEDAKTNLYALNKSSADPRGINARALGSARALVAPQAFTPLGQVFAAGLEPWLNYGKNLQGRPGAGYSSPYSATPTGSGSGRVIG